MRARVAACARHTGSARPAPPAGADILRASHSLTTPSLDALASSSGSAPDPADTAASPRTREACARSTDCCTLLVRRSHTLSDPSSHPVSSTLSDCCSSASARRGCVSVASSPPSPPTECTVTLAPAMSAYAAPEGPNRSPSASASSLAVYVQRPRAMSHMRSVRSCAQDSATRPLGWMASALMDPLWPFMSLRCSQPPPACQMAMLPSADPVSMCEGPPLAAGGQ
mmetsp:Transcript_17493/g.44045  ORF Transcript_17493/g.44045 Transcript_17493/m.44045 type:complete len:226 (-) Transcript_17493:287-964(-)